MPFLSFKIVPLYLIFTIYNDS
ncbi:hypothetical protein EMIT0P74_10325 [Pseudomonas sp. IT-P74]